MTIAAAAVVTAAPVAKLPLSEPASVEAQDRDSASEAVRAEGSAVAAYRAWTASTCPAGAARRDVDSVRPRDYPAAGYGHGARLGRQAG